MKNILLSAALCLQCMFSFAIRYNYGQHVVINKPVYENIYVAGGTIIVNAPVHGDLIIAGGTVIINDSVYNDILLGAGTVSFNGYVGGDIRCAGGRLDITKDVKGDIVAAGGNIHIGRDAVTGSLLASGGNVVVDGSVNGNLTGIFGDLEMNGRVAENAECRGRKITINGSIEGKSALSARTLVIGPGASFAGNVRYWTKSGQMDFGNTIENGKAVYDPTLQFSSGEWYFLGAATAAGLFLYLGMAALLILVIQYLFASTMKQATGVILRERNIPDPLDVLRFTAVKQRDDVLLNWMVPSYKEGVYFTVERSSDNVNFRELSRISSHRYSNEYCYRDEHPLKGRNYYRIRATDKSRENLSKVVVVEFKKSRICLIQPNPVHTGQLLTIRLIPAASNAVVEWLDPGRELISRSQINTNSGQFKVRVPFVTSGLYWFVVKTGDDIICRQVFVQ